MSRNEIIGKTSGNSELLKVFSLSVFLCVNLYLGCIQHLFSSFLKLTTTHAGIISTATYNGVDIGNRVNVFYYKLFIFATLFLFVYKFIFWIKNKIVSGRIFTLLSFIAALGTVLALPSFFGGSSKMLFIFDSILIVGISISYLNGKKVEIDRIVALLLIAVILIFVFKNEIHELFEKRNEVRLLKVLIVGLLGFCLFCLYKLFDKNIVLARVLLIVILMFPILNVLSSELFSVIYFRTHTVINPVYIKFFFCLVVGIVMYYSRKQIKFFSNQKFYKRYFYPLFVISFSLVAHYSFFQAQNHEMFELANPANAMMRLFAFGEIPLFEAFSSHLLSDQYYGILYNLLNGYDRSLGFVCYQFLDYVLIYILWYYTLLWITKKGWIAVSVILFFPYIWIALPGYHIISIISARLLYLLFTDYAPKYFSYLIWWSFFLILWRIDIGVANTISVSLLTLFLLIQKRDIKIVKDLIRALILPFGVLTSFLFVLYYFADFDLVNNLSQIYDYIKNNIAHGYAEVAYNKDRYYIFHYQLFPVLVVLILIFILVKFKVYQQQKIKMSYVVMILFFSLYYFFNTQRGIVRHSFIEGTDTFISSFVYLIIPLFIGYLLVQKSRLIWFMGIASVLVIFTKYNEIGSYRSNMNSVLENIQYDTSDPMNLVSRNCRIEKDDSFNKNQYFELKKMINTKFSDSSTYIDFSNSPMLYYYLQRKVPSVFNQYLQNTVSPYLQKENIRHLSSFDLPFVVFANYPSQWWDETDGVPNPLRYYHTVSYIYEHYKPWGIVNNRYLWIRKNIAIGNDILSVDSGFVYSAKHWNVQKLAYLLGNTKEEFVKKEIKIDQRSITVISDSTVSIALPKGINKVNGNWLVAEIENIEGGVTNLSVNCEVFAGKASDSFVFESKNEKGKSFYLLPVSSFYNWHIYDVGKIVLKMPSEKYRLISIGYTESL